MQKEVCDFLHSMLRLYADALVSYLLLFAIAHARIPVHMHENYHLDIDYRAGTRWDAEVPELDHGLLHDPRMFLFCDANGCYRIMI